MCAGCGRWYWTKADATLDTFLADHDPCFKAATLGYDVGSEAAYKACMRSRGWTRVQEPAHFQAPETPHYRGPEDDDEFRDADQQRYRSQIGSPADAKAAATDPSR